MVTHITYNKTKSTTDYKYLLHLASGLWLWMNYELELFSAVGPFSDTLVKCTPVLWLMLCRFINCDWSSFSRPFVSLSLTRLWMGYPGLLKWIFKLCSIHQELYLLIYILCSWSFIFLFVLQIFWYLIFLQEILIRIWRLWVDNQTNKSTNLKI